MQLTINGTVHEVPEALTLSQLLEQLGLASQRVAVERNGEVLPRSLHADTRLQPNDRLELIRAVGGG